MRVITRHHDACQVGGYAVIFLFAAYTRLVTFWLRPTIVQTVAQPGIRSGQHRADRRTWLDRIGRLVLDARPAPGPGHAGGNAARGFALALAVFLDLPALMLPALLGIMLVIYTGWASWWF